MVRCEQWNSAPELLFKDDRYSGSTALKSAALFVAVLTTTSTFAFLVAGDFVDGRRYGTVDASTRQGE